MVITTPPSIHHPTHLCGLPRPPPRVAEFPPSSTYCPPPRPAWSPSLPHCSPSRHLSVRPPRSPSLHQPHSHSPHPSRSSGQYYSTGCSWDWPRLCSPARRRLHCSARSCCVQLRVLDTREVCSVSAAGTRSWLSQGFTGPAIYRERYRKNHTREDVSAAPEPSVFADGARTNETSCSSDLGFASAPPRHRRGRR